MKTNRVSVSIPYMICGMLFCVCLIASNLLETKQFTLGSLELTCGLLVFPISYILNDCMVEVWGYAKARLIIWLGFALNAFFVLVGALADLIPGADYWGGDEGFHAIFGLAPRIVAASFVAFLVGSFANAYVMSRMKLRDGARRFSLRAIASTIVGETLDSLIFFPLAFAGVVPAKILPIMMLTQITLKTLYEVVILPITIRVVRWLKRLEGSDVYDRNVDYNVFKLKLEN